MNCEVGTSTLPPMWPHFFSEASWSSKCTPAAPASIMAFISSNALSGTAETGLGIGDDRRQPVRVVVAFGMVNLVGAQESLVDPAHDLRHAVGRIKALVGIHGAGEVGVGGDLPAGEVDGLQAGLYLLHGLVAGERAERVHERLRLEQLPEALGALLGECVADADCAAQADYVVGCVAAMDALPAGIVFPLTFDFFFGLHGFFGWFRL